MEERMGNTAPLGAKFRLDLSSPQGSKIVVPEKVNFSIQSWFLFGNLCGIITRKLKFRAESW